MFIRSKVVGGKAYYSVVRGERRDGRVCQVTIVPLGTHPTIEAAIEAADWRIYCDEKYLADTARSRSASVERERQRIRARIARDTALLDRLRSAQADMTRQSGTTSSAVVPEDPPRASRNSKTDTTPDDVVGAQQRPTLDEWCGAVLYFNDPQWGWCVRLVSEWSPDGIRYHELGYDLSDVLSRWDGDGVDPRHDADQLASKVRSLPRDASTVLISGGSWIEEGDGRVHGFDATVRAEVDRLLKAFAEEDESEREWEERKRQRAESRKVADWPQPERYIYWRSGEGKKTRWRAHRIQKEDEGYIIFSPACCRLRDIGTKADPHVKVRDFLAFGILHSVGTILFNGDYSHDIGPDGTLFLNCDAVRAAYVEDLTRVEVEENPWADFKDWAQDFNDKFREFFGDDDEDDSLDDYATLGVQPGCSAAELKAAYRKRAKDTHSDHGGADEEFIRIKAAYDRLSKFVA